MLSYVKISDASQADVKTFSFLIKKKNSQK